MKTTILYLVVASMAGMEHCSDESPAAMQEPENKELQALLEARRDTLKELAGVVEMHPVTVEHGRRLAARFADVLEVNTQLLQAELECARSAEERIACFERALEAQRKIERRLVAMAETGSVVPSDVFIATAARMKAEIELTREKNSASPVSGHSVTETPAEVERPDDDELPNDGERPGSPRARRDTLGQAARLIQDQVEAGIAAPDVLARASLLVLAAELEFVKTREEGISILEKILEAQTGIEESARSRWEVRTGNELDVLNAQAGREEAAINLYKVKKGEWPSSVGRGKENHSATQGAEDPELQTLLVEHRDTCKKIVPLVDSGFLQGSTRMINLINSNNALRDAEMELAKSPQERVAIFEEALKVQTKVEEVANKRYQLGMLNKVELLSATAARMKAEIDLHKARKKVK